MCESETSQLLNNMEWKMKMSSNFLFLLKVQLDVSLNNIGVKHCHCWDDVFFWEDKLENPHQLNLRFQRCPKNTNLLLCHTFCQLTEISFSFAYPLGSPRNCSIANLVRFSSLRVCMSSWRRMKYLRKKIPLLSLNLFSFGWTAGSIKTLNSRNKDRLIQRN